MKKIVIIAVTLAFAATASIICMQSTDTKAAFTLEWHELTPQTCKIMQPTLAQLQAIFVDAFVPVVKPNVYAHDPRLAHIPEDKKAVIEEKVVAGITESLQAGFDKKINDLCCDLQEKKLSAAYVAIARDSKQEAIGFALLYVEPLKDHLDKCLLTITEGSHDQVIAPTAGDSQIYVNFLMVKPGTQKKGVGKALVFAVLDHCPTVDTIYLVTPACDTNKNAQAFYEHVGFKAILKGTFISDFTANENCDLDCAKREILYMYKKA
jgi:GNAT superfamily N-acetyltransferase